MGRILFIVSNLHGTLNSARKVVRDLRANGHTVCFAGLPNCQPLLTDEHFVPVLSEFFPAPSTSPVLPAPQSRLQKLRSSRRAAARYRELIAYLAAGHDGGFERALQISQPDLAVIVLPVYSAVVWALLAYRFNLPVVYFNDSLWMPENSSMPPVTSPAMPSDGIGGRIRISLSWKLQNMREMFIQRIEHNLDYRGLVKTLARAMGYPLELLCKDEQFMRTMAPEIVAMPEAFDFVHPLRPSRYYSSACVDLSRPECDFPWDRLNPALPLIYCALGSLQLLKNAQYLAFYRCALEAFTAYAKSHQLVLAVGANVDPEAIGSVPDNVIVVRWAPQIALLKKSALMITHAGANTVKECITLGVPMLIYPLAMDQFGIAARAVFHGLGLKGDARNPDARDMHSKIGRLLRVPYYRMQVKRMQSEFAAADIKRPAARLIEWFVEQAN